MIGRVEMWVRDLKRMAIHLKSGGCPTPCDSDCDADCHEFHYPIWKRDH